MDYKKYNDYELIYMVRENDEDAKSIIWKKYTPIIRRIAYEYYQKYSNYGYEFDDFLQEAQLSFYQALSRYNEDKNTLFYTFINMCIRNRLSSFCRAITNKKNNDTLLNSVSINDDNYEDVKSNINSIYSEQDFQKIIKNIIYSSSFLSGVIIELRYNDFTLREISTLLDIPLTTVDYWCRKARKEVDYALKKYYDNL